MDRVSERARITAAAADWLNEHKAPGESVALAVEPARPDGWQLILRIGDVGVAAQLGAEPPGDTVRGVLVGLLADARRQAEIDRRVNAGRFG